jgi:hypothetical protein
VALLGLVAGPAAAHHVGSYVPRDNEISANFKQIKSAVQARKFDAALGLFDAGAVRAEMRAQARRLPAGLEGATRAALVAGDGPRAERGLVVFFAALIRDLALEADRRLAGGAEPPAERTATGVRFLEAIWRYYNLVDFAVSMRHGTVSVAMRLAFDEAEGYVRGTAAPAAVNPCAGPKDAARPVAADPDRLRGPLGRIAEVLGTLIEESSNPARRNS